MYQVMVLICLLALLATAQAQEARFQEPAAPGTSIGLSADALKAVESFTSDQPLVGTYLFYWYDVYSGAHVKYGDGGDACTTHPVSWDDYSFHSTRWWCEQLRDINAAGIDFAAPVYWGRPGEYNGWSFQGLPNMVRACDYLRRMGEKCPKIALFYDTSTLRDNWERKPTDLSTDDGKAWFYCTVRDFFSFVPPRLWAAIDGRPIILLYASAFATKQDPALFPYVRERFQKDFGVNPYIIKQTSWQGEADNTCNWGGALGLSLAGCAALGPGYDHSAVRGRAPLVRDRQGGAFYSQSWEMLLRQNPARRPKIVMVETWNEFHEGTDVAPSREYGRQYVDLTRRYADLFHAGTRLETGGGPYADARTVSCTLGEGGKEDGLAAAPSAGDGRYVNTTMAGRNCIQSTPNDTGGRYLYFRVDDSFAFDPDPAPFLITVEYLDAGPSAFALEYDSSDPAGSVREGAFKPAGRVELGGDQVWKTARFTVNDARFTNRTNGADFRLAVLGAGELCVARVEIARADGAR